MSSRSIQIICLYSLYSTFLTPKLVQKCLEDYSVSRFVFTKGETFHQYWNFEASIFPSMSTEAETVSHHGGGIQEAGDPEVNTNL